MMKRSIVKAVNYRKVVKNYPSYWNSSKELFRNSPPFGGAARLPEGREGA